MHNKGIIECSTPIVVTQPAEQPQVVKLEQPDPAEVVEANSFKSLRQLENKRAKARVSWVRAVAGHDQHVENLAEARVEAQKLDEKLQRKIKDSETDILEKKTAWDALEKSIAEKASEHSKLASSVGTGKDAPAPHLTEKQQADGAAKVWDTLEAKLGKVLGAAQLDDSKRAEVASLVAQAVLSAKVSLHDADDGDSQEEDDENMEEFIGEENDGVTSEELVPDSQGQPKPADGNPVDCRGSPWTAEPSAEERDDQGESPPTKLPRHAVGPYTRRATGAPQKKAGDDR